VILLAYSEFDLCALLTVAGISDEITIYIVLAHRKMISRNTEEANIVLSKNRVLFSVF